MKKKLLLVLEDELIRRLDFSMKKRGIKNRSTAIRQAITMFLRSKYDNELIKKNKEFKDKIVFLEKYLGELKKEIKK